VALVTARRGLSYDGQRLACEHAFVQRTTAFDHCPPPEPRRRGARATVRPHNVRNGASYSVPSGKMTPRGLWRAAKIGEARGSRPPVRSRARQFQHLCRQIPSAMITTRRFEYVPTPCPMRYVPAKRARQEGRKNRIEDRPAPTPRLMSFPQCWASRFTTESQPRFEERQCATKARWRGPAQTQGSWPI